MPYAGEDFEILDPNSIIVEDFVRSELSNRTKEIIQARTPNPNPNNPMPFLGDIRGDGDKTILPLYLGTFQDWRGTLPRGDQYDDELIKDDLMTPFNTTAIAVSNDGFFFAPLRAGGRQSHQGTLCFLNGYRLDRDIAANTIECHDEILADGTENELIRQSRGCIADQLNIPIGAVESSDILGLGASEPAIIDHGYHTLHLARLGLRKSEVINAANELYGDGKHSRYLKIVDGEHVFPFTEESLVKFCNAAPELMAMTQIPNAWLALANTFGPDALKRVDDLTIN